MNNEIWIQGINSKPNDSILWVSWHFKESFHSTEDFAFHVVHKISYCEGYYYKYTYDFVDGVNINLLPYDDSACVFVVHGNGVVDGNAMQNELMKLIITNILSVNRNVNCFIWKKIKQTKMFKYGII